MRRKPTWASVSVSHSPISPSISSSTSASISASASASASGSQDTRGIIIEKDTLALFGRAINKISVLRRRIRKMTTRNRDILLIQANSILMEEPMEITLPDGEEVKRPKRCRWNCGRYVEEDNTSEFCWECYHKWVKMILDYIEEQSN